jgi:hypothetical protein
VSRLEWPEGFERTPDHEREKNRRFDVSLAQAFDDIEAELERLGVDDYRYSFDAQSRQTDGRPYSRANPDDPSFVLRWSMDGQQFAVACDRWASLRDNVRSVGLYVREKRKMENRPVTTGESEFANARLPSADESAVPGDPPAHAVLGVAEDASDERVREAYRERLKEVHPDVGGDPETFKRVQRAREALLDEGGFR